MSEIRLENVIKTYNNGKVVALNNLSIECHDHELISILGPSGAGKTTTLKLIAGIEYPDSGAIYIDGRNVTDLPPQKRNVSMVFEGYALYPHLTVRENLEFPLKAPVRAKKYSKGEIRDIAERWAEKVGLGELLERKVDQLSGGQKQRVSLARALVRDASPSVILMDEPIAHLDAKLRVDMRTELKKLQQDLGATIIYVTHDYTEAMALSDRIIVINEGQLLQEGTPIEIYEQPKTEFVASVVGEPPMNFLPGEIITAADNTVFKLDSQSLIFAKANITNGMFDLGIRPSEFLVSKTSEQFCLSGSIQNILPTGAKQIMEVNVSGKRVLVKTNRDFSYSVGEMVFIKPMEQKAYLFNSETKERVFLDNGGNLNG